MRIDCLHVSNYRAIGDAELNLEPTTAIVGTNNAGKSTFLKALELFF
jgi:putative ATP-dependent endonuclease of OLD family